MPAVEDSILDERMLNARSDFFYPMDSSQLPMFDLCRPPDGQKRRVVYVEKRLVVLSLTDHSILSGCARSQLRMFLRDWSKILM